MIVSDRFSWGCYTERGYDIDEEYSNVGDWNRFSRSWICGLAGSDLYDLIEDTAPPPKGRPVTLTHYVDANLYHDCMTGRSVTGILHFINATPIDWFSKRQSTVETATYGSEFVAASVAIVAATPLLAK